MNQNLVIASLWKETFRSRLQAIHGNYGRCHGRLLHSSNPYFLDIGAAFEFTSPELDLETGDDDEGVQASVRRRDFASSEVLVAGDVNHNRILDILFQATYQLTVALSHLPHFRFIHSSLWGSHRYFLRVSFDFIFLVHCSHLWLLVPCTGRTWYLCSLTEVCCLHSDYLMQLW